MRAIHLVDPPDRLQLTYDDVSQPVPQQGEILIRVCAAGLTPTELTWYPTLHTKEGTPRTGTIPGHEFSGTVASVGRGVTGVRVGDPVFGMNEWFTQGAMAEYCVTSPEYVAQMPTRLSYAEASTVPISALTAWQGLYDRLELRNGERLLVQGGAGAVGAYVIQLAKLHGAEVISTASRKSFAFLQSIGVDRVIDHDSDTFENDIPKVDALFDTVGGEPLKRLWEVLKTNVRAVTIVEPLPDIDERTKLAFFIVEPEAKQLADIALLLDGGSLRPFVKGEISLSDAPDAYAGRSAFGSARGKVAVVVASANSF